MPRHSELEICKVLGICPWPLTDALTREIFRMFVLIRGGAPWPWPTLLDTPAPFVSGYMLLLNATVE